MTLLIDNRYRHLSTLGKGAMGLVALVEDVSRGEEVALKVISPQAGAREKTVLQFKQEFRLMTQLRHPNCCRVHDYGETAYYTIPEAAQPPRSGGPPARRGEPYFTMEVVPGHGLDELIASSGSRPGGEAAQGGIDEAVFRRIFPQLLLALGYIHQRGLVHGDLKSANVRVRPDGVLKLMDYGLMDYAGRTGGPIRGTPAYMAPEVIRRAPVDQRSDLYSAGCLAYELLTGVLPFGGTQETVTATQLLRQHVAEKPLPLETFRPGISAELNQIVQRLLDKDPMRRYQSAFQVLEALGAEVPAGLGGHLLASPLLGREEALATLSGALDGLGRAGQALVVSGPAGIGKSRLLEEFRYTVQLAGVPCHGGNCIEQASPPYGPFLPLLNSLLPAWREQLPAELEVQAPVLVKLLPELGVTPAPDMESPKSEMMRLHAAIAHLLGALAARRPYALVLENWQWADPLSRALLDYLLRNLGDAPLLLVVTTRGTPEEGQALAELPRLELQALAGEDLSRMVCSMLGSPEVDPAFLQRIGEFSEGNPFMVERLLEHLVRTKALQYSRGRWNTGSALADRELPVGLGAVLLRGIAELSTAAQSLAGLGAVVGHQFDLPLLAEVSGLPEEQLFDVLGELYAANVLLQAEDGMIGFVQDQLPELLYAQLDAPRLSRLHHEVARVLERRLEGDLADAPLELVTALARHCLAGKAEAARTLPYVLEAGERNRRLFALAEAERLLAAGLELLAGEPPELHRELRFGFMSGLGELKRVTARAAEGRALLEPALELAQALGLPRLGRLTTSLGKTLQMVQEFEKAEATFERSVALCRADDDAMGASRALLSSSRLAVFRGEAARALSLADAALAEAIRSGDATQRGLAHAWIGYMIVSSAPERLDEGVANLQTSLQLLGQTGDRIGQLTSYQLLGNAQLILGDLAAAHGSFEQTRRLAYEVGSREEEAFGSINLAIVTLDLGDFPRALNWAVEAGERVAKMDARFPRATAMVIEAEARAYLADDAKALALAGESLAIAREIKHKYLEALVLMHQLELLAFLGRVTEAHEAATALTALIENTGNTEQQSRLDACRAELALRAGQRAEAREAAERALAAARAARARAMEVRALKALARTIQAGGDYAGARERALEALVLSQALGMRYLQAELYGLAGETGLALGDGTAGANFDAMATLATELGCPPLLAQARFGQAAARPYEGGADRAAEGRAILEAWLERLSPEGRGSFTGYVERKRVLDGNYIGFSLPLRPRPTGRETGPLSLRPGMRGTGEL